MTKCLISTIIVLFLAICIVSPVNAELSWNVQILDEVGSWTFCPLVLDSNDNPHIVYQGRQAYTKYGSWNGSDWNIEQLGLGTPYGLVLDANNNPYILYAGPKYLNWNGTEWDTHSPLSSIDTKYVSFALDSSDNLHVAYMLNGELKYASWTGTKWAYQTVTVEDYDTPLSLAIDENDAPYIMYSSPSSSVDGLTGTEYGSLEVKFAIWENSSWAIQTVLNSSNLVGLGNMVLDSQGNPHFLCTQRRYFNVEQTFYRHILHASWNGSAWSLETAAANVSLYQLGFLALDPDDSPHVIYITKDYQLKYTRWADSTWKDDTIETDRIVDKPCSLTIDSNDNPHISYLKVPLDQAYNGPILNLMYATTQLPLTLNVSISSPENKTYTSNEFPLTFATNNQVSSLLYSLDGTSNVSITENTTLTGLSNGAHSIVVYALDEDGNVGAFDTIHFTVDAPEFPLFTVAVIVVIIIACAALLFFFKTRKHAPQNQ